MNWIREVRMLEELLDDESDTMSSWEVEFIDNLRKSKTSAMTDRQKEKLEQIWEKVFG